MTKKTIMVRLIGNKTANLDGLYALQGVLERNRGECELPIGTLTRQVLDLACKSLESSNVYDAGFPNGERVLFVERLPMSVSEDAVIRAAMKNRTTFRGHVGLHFIDAWKLKNLSFQLINSETGHSDATVEIVEGDIVRTLTVKRLEHRRKAIEKLARIYYTRQFSANKS